MKNQLNREVAQPTAETTTEAEKVAVKPEQLKKKDEVRPEILPPPKSAKVETEKVEQTPTETTQPKYRKRPKGTFGIRFTPREETAKDTQVEQVENKDTKSAGVKKLEVFRTYKSLKQAINLPAKQAIALLTKEVEARRKRNRNLIDDYPPTESIVKPTEPKVESAQVELTETANTSLLVTEKTPRKNYWKIGTILLVAVLIVGGITFGLMKSEPQQITTFAEKDLKIKGNRSTRIFHLQHCPNYKNIGERNIIWFKTIEEAKQAGYRMAKNC